MHSNKSARLFRTNKTNWKTKMEAKLSVLFNLSGLTEMSYCLKMNNVCSTDDIRCNKPNISGIGMIVKGKCSLTWVLLRFRKLSLLGCAKECFITSQYMFINYRQKRKLSDLVMVDPKGNVIDTDSTSVNIDITTWNKIYLSISISFHFWIQLDGMSLFNVLCIGFPWLHLK